LAHSLSGSVAVVTLAHRPSAAPVFAFEHAWQVLPHALEQQNPSTQLPPEHSALAAQTAPWAFCAWHTPALQKLPAWQSAMVAQVVLQLDAPHT